MFELPYVAGLVDGEGTIGFSEDPRNLRIRLYVGVTNTRLDMLQLLKDQFGGSITSKGKMPVRHKPVYMWRLTTDQAAEFIAKIYPWLFIKHKQATLALHFHRIKPDKTVQHVVDLFRDGMHELNKRGVDVTQ